MGHKRKRDSDAANETERPEKTQVLEGDNKTPTEIPEKLKKKIKSGERRQVRSERKAKRSGIAKEKSKKKSVEAESFTPNTNGVDTLAAGEDFVRLDGEVVQAEKPAKSPKVPKPAKTEKSATKAGKVKKGFLEAKAKKASPRSIRKQEKEHKIKSAMIEEGLADVSSGANGAPISKNGETAGAAPRFICFVGNLPFDATTEEIQAHFHKLAPKSVRHSTDKATGKSKGFAFLEFDQYDKMKTCLKLYHHSIFDPVRTAETGDVKQAVGRNRTMRGRKLNVELTAGGGGKSGSRVKKIKDKNEKLNQERVRVKLQEQQKEAASGRQKSQKREAEPASGANMIVADDAASRGAIHPSRMSRVQG